MLIFKLFKFLVSKKNSHSLLSSVIYSIFYLSDSSNRKKTKSINSKDDVYPLF